MSSSQARLDLLVDVFELQGQQARVLTSIKPPELVEAVLEEFRELEVLSDDPSAYYLVKADDHMPLDDTVEIGRQQLRKDDRLILEERTQPIPENTQKLAQHVYLREQNSGKVYRLHWQPAIIGRRAESQPHGEWVAVDLQPFPTGLRASRRHLMITEANGQFYVENLAKNPAAILRNRDTTIPIDTDKARLLPDDIIWLERSQISLKFIVRNGHDEETLDAPGDETAVATTTDSVARVPLDS